MDKDRNSLILSFNAVVTPLTLAIWEEPHTTIFFYWVGHVYLLQTCHPLGIKNCILWSQKLYFPPQETCILIIKTIYWVWKKYFCGGARMHEREVISAGVQGPKGPGSTRILGALWCNLSLIFEHYYSKTLTKLFINNVSIVELSTSPVETQKNMAILWQRKS